jgi:hypothetical protein
MFIIWGKKIVYRKLGHVADFCPICRAPKPFELKRVGSAGHVYYISAGEGELVGYERTCQECGTSFAAEPTTYAAIAKSSAPLADLVKQTYPNILQVLQERLALEEKVRHAPTLLTPEERNALIRSPFVLLSPRVEKRFSSTHIDKEVGLSLVGALLLLVLGPAISRVVAPDASDMAALVFLGMGVLLVGWQVVISGRRFMRRQIVPVLASSLKPLRPTEKELQSVLAELKQVRNKMGAKLVLSDLQEHMAQSAQPA